MAESVCPVWIGYFLASPVRKLFQNPEKILRPYIRKGMNVLDIGCAMGFFSLPLARMVGSNGRVICVDMQEKMITSLEKRARRAGVSDRIETHLCRQNSLNLQEVKEQIDFALAFAVVHEVPDASVLFAEVYEAMKSGGKFLVAEPKGHLSEKDFEVTISIARQSGFRKAADSPEIAHSRVVLLEK
ncbi:class I SAM-dependent methyltransferase [Desulfonema magnum]|uniref:SAM-dependent DNA methylase n=1 Tax=Desulfonema magnum TaxID=45655 RepID=A0A975GPS9_9BACT|nr:class I SAM-dependent methyltransferase [Desulfonema magnum]QTA89130.1 SAM-dependent DNA methylase [Desulfonema magnum]